MKRFSIANMPPSARARVAVVDPHPLFRSALEHVCEGSSELEFVCGCGRGEEAVRRLPAVRPDVIVTELRLPDVAGVRLLDALAEACPSAGVLVLTAEREGGAAFRALGAGAAGYICKEAEHSEVVEAIRAVASGETVISPALHRSVVAEIRLYVARDTIALTARERDVLTLVAQGFTSAEIGRKLFISSATVKSHLTNMYEKLGVSDRAAAVAQAMKRGLVEAA
jgi:two-component system, NarL family, nitrate/nitrite response regulator NarL